MNKSYKDSHKSIDIAKNYDKVVNNKFEHRIYQVENIILKEYLDKYLNKKSKILDFACWTWRITSFLKKYFDDITWFDISENMLSVAREKYPDIEFRNVDLWTDKIDEKFDGIIAFRFFLNAETPLKEYILENFKSILNLNWTIIFNIHMNSRSIAFFLTRMKHMLWLNPLKQNWISYNKMKKIVENHGYKVVESKWYSFFLWNPLLTRIPYNWLKSIDLFLSKFSFLKYFSKDLIYVIKLR